MTRRIFFAGVVALVLGAFSAPSRIEPGIVKSQIDSGNPKVM